MGPRQEAYHNGKNFQFKLFSPPFNSLTFAPLIQMPGPFLCNAQVLGPVSTHLVICALYFIDHNKLVYIANMIDFSANNLPVTLMLTALLVIQSIFLIRQRQILKRKNYRLRNRLEAAKVAANRIKGLFFANISHEIRTPLNAILGHAQLLHRNEQLDEKQQQQLQQIIDASSQLSDLINDLLSISSIASDSMSLQNKNFDLSDLVAGLASIFEKRSINKGVLFQFYHCSPVEMLVYADQGKLRQILVKLLGNAVKFTTEGQVDFRIEECENKIRFTISDTGPGMSHHQQKVIFNPFEHRRKQTGIGISMAIVKHHIEMMRGTLEIDSVLGEGTQFRFELPLEPARGPVNSRQLRCHRVKRLLPPFDDPNNPVRILVVDENQQTRHILISMLADVGIAVIEADDGRSALDILRQLPKAYMPSMVIYDISVPLHTDARRLARIYRQYAPEGMEFVVLAALAVQVEIQQYLQYEGQQGDFHHFVAKPYRFEAIYQLIHQLLHVEFDYHAPQPKAEAKIKLNPQNCAISRLDYQNIVNAANDYEVSRVESLLAQLQYSSPKQKPLCDHLNTFINHYDMEGLMAELNKVRVTDE